ncbi:hypothetical protein [Affinirhizobium pseudoryzae]|uniref:hypothetical protein n=1 Tax=Allorhizobium pseudoryzae TaxID=379684 RepID=UPI0019CF6539|nr:hypothetical protein [Allorhizobium pseudoryzae]
MRRCTIILPDAGPINSLWVADRLHLLLDLDMRIVIVDAVYDELTSDLSYRKDAEVKDFIDGNSPPFVIERTDIGEAERQKRRLGHKLKKNAGELAMVDPQRSAVRGSPERDAVHPKFEHWIGVPHCGEGGWTTAPSSYRALTGRHTPDWPSGPI